MNNQRRKQVDSMPEGLQQSERGQASENAANELHAAVDYMESAVSA